MTDREVAKEMKVADRLKKRAAERIRRKRNLLRCIDLIVDGLKGG